MQALSKKKVGIFLKIVVGKKTIFQYFLICYILTLYPKEQGPFMSTFICQKCKKEVEEKIALYVKSNFYCPTCKRPLSYFGQEDVFLSQPIANIQQDTSKKSESQFYGKNMVYENPQINMMILEYEDALKINANNLTALLGLGKLYQSKKNIPKAEKYFLELIRLKPDHIETRQHLAEIYLTQTNYDKAIEQLNILKELEPQNYLLNYNLGLIYDKQNDVRNALMCFQEALEHTQNEAFKKEIEKHIQKLTQS